MSSRTRRRTAPERKKVSMDVNRYIAVMVLEVVKALVERLGFKDLLKTCEECQHEVDASGELEKKEG